MSNLKGERYLNSLQKRYLDIAEVSLITPIAIMAIALGALAVKIEGCNDIFYTQKRMGKDEKPFKIFKIKTMKDSNLQYVFPKTLNDDRTTRVGKILRPLGIDELPQLIINILIKHEMSLFGIRAYPVEQYYEMLKMSETYPLVFSEQFINEWKGSYDCAPPGGLSLAIAKGRSSLSMDVDGLKKKMEYDIEYVKKASPTYDLSILFEAAISYLTKKGFW